MSSSHGHRTAARWSPRIAEQIAADLRQRILGGTFPDGPLPKQDELIEEYGVSAPSVREALRILEAEGLITVRRGKLGGAYIHRPSWASSAYAFGLSLQGQGVTLQDLAVAIRGLEPECARACARREDRVEAVIPALRENIAASESTIGVGSHFTTVSRVFHDILVDHVPNMTFRLMVRSLVAVWTIQELACADAMEAEGRFPANVHQEHAVDAHREITAMIEAGDADGAALAVQHHIDETQPGVLEFFGNRIVDASSAIAVQRFRAL